MEEKMLFRPGQRITHAEFGEGVIVEQPQDGYIRAFFSIGEKVVPITTIRGETPRNERILSNVLGTAERIRKVWLTFESYALPLMESAAALTAAKIDLLPHQVVLTHRIATASPRRYLIADEVGLGKTIETALILRELFSRGELKRALMIVPAGLVNNWHRELNTVFNLDFEVFGSEGDVTDRKTNAFAKHDLLIASIDTLKRPARVMRILDAPRWDLIVFDEAHHLTAHRTGSKIHKTENYKLAEALRIHCRDMLMLSATPHQGDHFRFWMLIQLLNPTLFKHPEDMVENRHRLNAVVFRRTKADSCKPDGSPLFARRQVHTESFVMSEVEKVFYDRLRAYLEDGFALAKRQGNKGRSLGFVMAIFQKIAASSFAAVRRTLRRRLLNLTIHEGILRDRDLDIDARQALYDEARQLIREEYLLGDDPIGRGQVDRVLADLKVKILKKLDEDELRMSADSFSTEYAADHAEDIAVAAVSLALPQERDRIRELLATSMADRETKVEKLLKALGALWRINPSEKVVVFATYLGTVDLLGREIDAMYPGQGVVVLKGGDHGAKLAAERRFKVPDGPKVLVCTAAGREGINLQTSRILFNFDLPWNPMDVEQRIGRIHRYKQQHTAQVYNLVLSDTIEGRIFLLLEDKLGEIAAALGKMDDAGNVAEDFRSQILGQLAEKLSYERLYQDALSDPELHRTKLELEAALANAKEARHVVFELFQDLEGFSLEDYKPFADIEAGINRLSRFLGAALADKGQKIVRIIEDIFELRGPNAEMLLRFTTNRNIARERDDLDLLGMDHPIVKQSLELWRNESPEEMGASVKNDDQEEGVLSWWVVHSHSSKGEQKYYLVPLAARLDGTRMPIWEKLAEKIMHLPPAISSLDKAQRCQILRDHLEPMLHRELRHRGIADNSGAFSAELIAWVELVSLTKK